MRRIAIVVMCLCGLVWAQAGYTGGATWTGGGIWGAGFQSGPGYSDLPLPDFTSQGGVTLSLPQVWVDPLEAFSQTISNTVYVGNISNGCPTAPARTNYKSQVKSAGQCDFADTDGTGLATVMSDWAGAPDQRWHVVVTHGATFTLNCSNGTCWVWNTKYNGTAPSKYLTYGSDCTAATPCTGTNDLGYDPPGRQVCSHGVNDYLMPALPSMGQRNHGCQGFLGTVPSTYSIPVPVVTPGALGPYTYDANYNDVANMFTITVTGATSPISMGPAYTPTSGSYPQTCNNADPTQIGTDYCPVQGVNHVWMTDIHITSSMNDSTYNQNQYSAVDFSAAEWSGAPDATAGYAGAVANHVGLSQFYLEGAGDDDGFGLPHVINGVKLACSYCAIAHGYIDGVKAVGGESHTVTLNGGIGPVMVADNWIESGSIGLWGGGGGNPAIRGNVPADIEARRNRITYHKRWLPPPAGNEPNSKSVQAGGTCSGPSASIIVNNAPGTGATQTNIAATGVYTAGVTGITNGWYRLDSAPVQTTPETIVISATNNPGFSCTGSPTSGKVWGFAANYGGVPAVDVAAMNSKGTGGHPDNAGGYLCQTLRGPKAQPFALAQRSKRLATEPVDSCVGANPKPSFPIRKQRFD